MSKFKFFIANCTTNVQKLQWLQTSVENEAVGLIKHFSLVDDNYEIALKKLKDRYSNPDVVKHLLLQSIISFKCDSGPKFSKTQSAATAFSNALDELSTVHNLPYGEELSKELLREIMFYNLPYEVRKGLIEETNNNYPPITEIIAKLDKVITKLNITGISSTTSKNNSQSNVTKSNLNEITTMNVNHSKSNASNNAFNKKTRGNCWFCGTAGHFFWTCTQFKTKDQRLKVLKDKFPDNCTSCGFKHDSQKCSSKSECPDDSCNIANGKHYKLSCPKFVQSKPISVQQVSVSPYIYNEDGVAVEFNPDYKGPLRGHATIVNIDGSVVELGPEAVVPQSENVVNIEGKSVALPTAVYTATNENALKLPLDQRNIAI